MKSREAKLQSACLKWFRYQYPKLSKILIAVPNGGSRNPIEAINLKSQGVTPGVADLLLLAPKNGFGCLCIEMKTDISKQSKIQFEWQIEAEKSGNKYVVCRSFDEFRKEINSYLNKKL